MKHKVTVPTVGESISEVTIAQWLKSDGDHVEENDLICEIESDKASFEIPAENSGTLKILADEGETIAIGGEIAEIDGEGQNDAQSGSTKTKASSDPQPDEKQAAGEASSSDASTEKADDRRTPQASDSGGEDHEVKIPTVGESISEVTIAAWLVADGASVAADDLICEIESDKASFEIPAEREGILQHLAKEGDTVSIGERIATISGGSGAGKEKESVGAETDKQGSDTGSGDDRKVKVSPVAANILDEAGIAPEKVQGSGPGGKITKEDARRAVADAQSKPEKETQKTKPQQGNGQAKAPVPKPESLEKEDRNERRERMSTLRKTIARRLVASKNETAMLTTFNEADMSAIMDMRKKYKEIFKEKYEVGLGFMSFFTRAVCLAMKDWPSVNAMIDGDYIVYNDYVDISIAVSTPRGLVVPVIRNAEKLSLAGIEREVVNLATKARDNKLTIEEMTGGTFTITNGGVFGSLMSTPIINQPQSAILGMHKIEQRPVVIDGQIVIRPMMYLAVSYDHRIIDGRESVGFLVRVKELLEDPSRMLLEV